MNDYLIVGLGNPGRKYQGTRHNVGHWMIDQMKSLEFFPPYARLLKSGVYMNSSGHWVKERVDKNDIALNNLVVMHDDVDLGWGDYRLQKGRSSAGHHGVESVIEQLGSQDFWRLRIGIGRPTRGLDVSEYVLDQTRLPEKELLAEIVPSVVSALEKLMEEGRSKVN